MISKLFKPIWEHKDPQRRIAAIAEFSEENVSQQEILETIAQTDVESNVRVAAISRLTNIRTLERLRLSVNGEAAQARLLQLLSSKEEAHNKLVAEFVAEAELETLLHILRYSPSAEARELALGMITEQEQLASIASDSEFADTREAAAALVDRLDLLEPLWKKVRERDKNLAKNLHQRIEELKQVASRRAQVVEQAEGVIASMDELKKSVWTPQYNLHFLALVNQWQQIESEVEPDLGDKYRELAIGVEAEVIEHRRVLEVIEKQQQLLLDAEQLQFDARELSLSELEVQMERWAMLRRLWLDSLAVSIPEESIGQRFDEVASYFLAIERILAHQTVFVGLTAEPGEESLDEAPAANSGSESEVMPESTIKLESDTEVGGAKESGAQQQIQGSELQQQIGQMRRAIKSIDWPPVIDEPAALSNLKNFLESQEAALKEQAAQQRQQVESTGKQIARLNAAVRRGDLKMARGVYKKIESRFERLRSDQQNKLQEQWDRSGKAYREMLDWKEFAIQPKFIELCEQMEALADSAQPPQQQAEAIKKLQQSWKKLEALAPNEVWQRFQTAGDKAFEPCAAFYAELDVQRAENLEQRKFVLEKLIALSKLPEQEDWQESPDWKSLRDGLREVREQWQKYAEVDQQKCRKLGKKYANLTRNLEKYIKAECQANLSRKKQLVDRAVTMSAMDSAAISLDQLKELQASWKHIGITERRDDQKMWKAFQEACDAVFAKHRQKIDESRAEEKAQSENAKKLIQLIRALAETEPNEVPDESRVNELLEEYRQLPPLHEPIQKALDRDLQKATDAVQSAIKKFKRDRENQYFLEMQRRAEICASLEALDKAKDAAKVEKLLGDWESQPLPSEVAQLMDMRKQAALAKKYVKSDFDEASRNRRLICIELEALLSKDTPAEDHSLRMEYQLEQMKSKGLGANSIRDMKVVSEQARKRWYQMPTADKKTQSLLDERFFQLINLVDAK